MNDQAQRPSYAALTKALCQARSKLSGTVFKSGMNQHQRYAYVGHEQVVRSGAREALGECGLALVQTNVELVSDAVPAGKVQAHLYRGEFLLLHESGESLPLTFLATVQPNDKSAFVASTSLDRVALLRLLCLAGSSDEDPESDWHDQQTQRDRSGATPGQLNGQQAQQAAPPPIDAAVLKLISELELATADKLDGLLASARGMFRSVFPDERKALQGAVEFAKARVQKLQDEAAAAAAQSGGAQ
jgi:hypothetical protein